MNLFADFQTRIATLLEGRIAAGQLPVGLDLGRFGVEPPREGGGDGAVGETTQPLGAGEQPADLVAVETAPVVQLGGVAGL